VNRMSASLRSRSSRVLVCGFFTPCLNRMTASPHCVPSHPQEPRAVVSVQSLGVRATPTHWSRTHPYALKGMRVR